MKLNLACGGRYMEGYVNVDWSANAKTDLMKDLFKFPYPWEDSSADEIQVHHFVEHIPHQLPGITQNGLVMFMEECHRIMKPGALMYVSHPHPLSASFWGDPTHCRNVHPMTWFYFNKAWRDASLGGVYDFKCDFEVVEQTSRLACPKEADDATKEAMLTLIPGGVTECFSTLKALK